MSVGYDEACGILRKKGLLLNGDSLRPRISERTARGQKIVFVRMSKFLWYRFERIHAYEVASDDRIVDVSRNERKIARKRKELRKHRLETYERLLEIYRVEREEKKRWS